MQPRTQALNSGPSSDAATGLPRHDGPAGAGAGGQSGVGTAASPPTLTLPKGGGALRGIGEKFSVDAATGTGSVTVPVAVSPGRAGSTPELTLAYDSGAGNGPFGLGWSTHLPAVSRKTDRGLPRYLDDPDADTFILSGAQDLVPVREEQPDGTWEQVARHRTEAGRRYAVQAYRPRVEAAFARIERWRDVGSGETHWRSISAANVTTLYGADAESRIADPAEPDRVFSWLISETRHPLGHVTRYEYRPENSEGVDTGRPHERHRTALSRSANRYLKRISYGNRVPYRAGGWMFEVVFDYGDHDAGEPGPRPDRPWPARPDPFSTYRPGFEVRTYRRCRRILMFHQFPDEPGVGADCLVSSTDLEYLDTGSGAMTTIATVTHTGYRRRAEGGYRRASLPPVEFGYSRPVIGREPRDVDPRSLENLPAGLGPDDYQLVDLDGEGLSGVLARQGGAWFYHANLGGAHFSHQRLLAAQPAAGIGGPGAEAAPRRELLDLTGDGRLDLVELDGRDPGYYHRGTEPSGTSRWRAFRPFPSRPDIAWQDPDLLMLDLDGDGLSDVLVTGEEFTWYPSLGPDGFGSARRAFPPWSDEDGARVVFADPEQTIHLADMTGDGLSDLVRVRDGEVCYWPNLGYGRFGARVVMDRAPWLDGPELFDQRRVRLADVDGSGTADLVYLHPDGARLYLNLSGNALSEPHRLPSAFPQLDSVSEVSVTDLLGNGTACLVWSGALPADSGRQLRYLDLMAEGKPHLLTSVVNNLGAETRIEYEPSTRYYLADRAAGRPWATRLPFPVQVVARVETIDRINRNRFTVRYSYHHGHFDGVEREFRGFGMVEHWDTADFAVLGARESGGVEGVSGSERFANLDAATSVPPMLTRTWFHTGVGEAVEHVSRAEYYRDADGAGPRWPGVELPRELRPTGGAPRPWRLSPAEEREARQALKGSMLREEVYALDGSEAEGRPYSISEHTYAVDLLQPGIDPIADGPWNYHAVFLTHARETVTAHYERALYEIDDRLTADPRVTRDYVLEFDGYGNPVHEVSIAHGRKHRDPALHPEEQAEQRRTHVTSTHHRYTNPIDLSDAHRTPLPAETRTYEIRGLDLDRVRTPGELCETLAAIKTELPYQDWNADSDRLSPSARRLIEHARIRYCRDDLAGPLPLGTVQPLALPYRNYEKAFTDALVADLYGDRVDDDVLIDAGYVEADGGWWVPSGTVHYSPGDETPEAELEYARRHFFLPHCFLDPYGRPTVIGYDRYDVLVTGSLDPLGNRTSAGERSADRPDVPAASGPSGLDYRVLAPDLISDPNRNRAAAAFDTLGRVAGTAVQGKPEEQLGDSLDGFMPDLGPDDVAAYFADPLGTAHRLLGSATSRVVYDVDAYRREGRPPADATLARETHLSDLAPDQTSRIMHTLVYSDGFGRDVQHKEQAAPGPLDDADAQGNGSGNGDRHDADQHGTDQHGTGPAAATADPRWIGSGWTVVDNKGNPVRTYEPFFSATHEFEFARLQGVSSVVFYDPVGRAVATLHPDGAYEKSVFDPWLHRVWDTNDTVLLDPCEDPDVRGYVRRYLATQRAPATWYEQRAGGELGAEQWRAARKAAAHAGTPALIWSDSLSRPFLKVAHNRTPGDDGRRDEYYRTRTVFDIEGNVREVRDARGRTVVRHGYTMRGGQVTGAGMDTARGSLLPDVTGNPVRTWTGRGFTFRTEYDALRRPTAAYVQGPDIDRPVLYLRTDYGESLPDAEERNLRTRPARQYNTSGVIEHGAYDFKGNPLVLERRLAEDFRALVDWSADPPLEERTYAESTAFDALNRPVRVTTPDSSILTPHYDETGRLKRLDGRVRGAGDHAETEGTALDDTASDDTALDNTVFVASLAYNARGQRILAEYGNGTVRRHNYDPFTFRLTRTLTLRGRERLQDLRYAYDPVGNPVSAHDRSLQPVFFRNRVAESGSDYTYDAIYRLIEATGREHLGQVDGGRRVIPPSASDARQLHLPQPGDGGAMARYAQRFRYDQVGNLLRVAHRSADPAYGGWTREYRYLESSLLEPDVPGDRLTGTLVPGGSLDAAEAALHRFGYDAQGNITALPEIPTMTWDPEERLHVTSRQAAGAERHDADRTYYTYDNTGQRVRKVTARAEGGPRTERIYLGGFEVYREYHPDGTLSLERQTLHATDDERRVALVETRTVGTDEGAARLVRYQYGDQLESSLLELDDTAAVISYEQYHPYGSTAYQAVRTALETPKRYRYTGKERDTETGLYYHGARYYAPWLGRWTACDPARLADGTNSYAYVRGNPVRLGDPDGRQSKNPDQLHFVEGPAYEQQATATATSRGFSKGLRQYYRSVKKAWGHTEKTDIVHPKSTPFATQKPGQTTNVRLGAAGPNRSAGALSKPALKASGLPMRNPKGLYPGATKGTRYGQPGIRPNSQPYTIKPKALEVHQGSTTPPPTPKQVAPVAKNTAVAAQPDPVPAAGGGGKTPGALPDNTAVLENPAAVVDKPPVPVVEHQAPTTPPEQLGLFPESAGTGIKSFGSGVLSLAPGLLLEYGRGKMQERYDNAAKVREGMTGAPTPDQIKQQHNLGWEYRGLDDKGGPKWEYDPGWDLRLDNAVHYLFNPFEPLRPSGHEPSVCDVGTCA